MILSDLFYLVLIIGFIVLFWQHMEVSQRAYRAAKTYTSELGLTLLDQSVVLKSIRLRKSGNALFALERRYHFEFCSIGDERYPGKIVFVGKRQQKIELSPYKTRDQQVPIEP